VATVSPSARTRRRSRAQRLLADHRQEAEDVTVPSSDTVAVSPSGVMDPWANPFRLDAGYRRDGRGENMTSPRWLATRGGSDHGPFGRRPATRRPWRAALGYLVGSIWVAPPRSWFHAPGWRSFSHTRLRRGGNALQAGQVRVCEKRACGEARPPGTRAPARSDRGVTRDPHPPPIQRRGRTGDDDRRSAKERCQPGQVEGIGGPPEGLARERQTQRGGDDAPQQCNERGSWSAPGLLARILQ
jgi:hypothetical protein